LRFRDKDLQKERQSIDQEGTRASASIHQKQYGNRYRQPATAPRPDLPRRCALCALL